MSVTYMGKPVIVDNDCMPDRINFDGEKFYMHPRVVAALESAAKIVLVKEEKHG